MEQTNYQAAQASPPQPALPVRKAWTVGPQERRLLPLTLALAYLIASANIWKWLGFGMTVLTAAWYAVLFLYRGTAGMERRVNRILMGAVILLALTFTLFSNLWFKTWNYLALVLLVAIHIWELCGGTRLPWYRAGMLLERMVLLVTGPFACWGAIPDTLRSVKKQTGLGRWLPALVGVGVTLPALSIVTMVLMDADAVFALVAGNAVEWLVSHFGQAAVRLAAAVCLMPLLFSLLYFAAHTKTAEKAEKAEKTEKEHNPLPAVILLQALDLLYLFFLAVQSAALFGDRAYLQRAGISFAEYARSGFFQLSGLAGVNIALILAVVWLCRTDRRVRVLSTVLVGLTAVLLVSAGWRMTLYVCAYGLSFKRLLTYWGMAILAVFLALTLRKIWRKDFAFFRAAAPVALAWWLLLNYSNVDAVVARYNGEQVERGRLAYSAVEDLLYNRGGYDGLPELAGYLTDPDILPWVQELAAGDCGSWATWNVSAWRAGKIG